MAEELKILIKKRGSIKFKLTAFVKFLENLSLDETEENEGVFEEIEQRLDRMQLLYGEFEEIQIEIAAKISDDQYADVWEKYQTEFDDIYFKVVGRAKKLLKKHALKNKSDNISESGSISSEVKLRTRPELPSIPIPTFNGELEGWIEFRDTFISLVHENDSLSDIEKFHFLKSALQGEAQKVIQGVKFSKENYKVVWDQLCDRYNDTPMLVNYYLSSLVKLPPMTKESASDLRRMSDTIINSLFALDKLGIVVTSWDSLVIYIMLEKLDQKTFAHWQESKPKRIVPTLDQFKNFLKGRIVTLRDIENNRKETKVENKYFQKPKVQKSFLATASSGCASCQRNHDISECKSFLKLKVYDRYQELKRLGLCLSCFKKGHMSRACTDASICKKCNGKHNSLLHYENQPESGNSVSDSRSIEGSKQTTSDQQTSTSLVGSNFIEYNSVPHGEVLLSTALVDVVDSEGGSLTCRVLLDNGSQVSLITVELCTELNLEVEQVDIAIIGINQVVSEINKRSTVRIKSRCTDFQCEIPCLVVPIISDAIPNQSIDTCHLDIPDHLKLADPEFGKRRQIDILLGANIFYNLLCDGQISLGKCMPILQKTRLGWLVSGSVSPGSKSSSVKCNLGMNCEIQEQLSKFWEIEEPPSTSSRMTEDELECERMFRDTTKRCEDGKFMVQIPLCDSPDKLGESRELAVRRMLALEKRLSKNRVMEKMYVDFMEEYKTLGHMSLVGLESECAQKSYYLPHHGVLNEKSITTKLRVVFNGSSVTTSGFSYNDIQYTGPKIQDDLWSILIRFRKHPIVVCGDIEKMYRMVLVDPRQRSLQKILWRSKPEEELQEFTLNTVTYGTKSAPYLAIRCIEQLGLDSARQYPGASEVILHDFYVDDMMSGAETVSEAIVMCKQVSQILESGGFRLRKWISNSSEVLRAVDVDETGGNKHFGENEQTKTLGLYWAPCSDKLMYCVRFNDPSSKCTKRLVLSQVSRIFDPLGLLGPCIVLAKILLQRLWEEHLSWDDELPIELAKKWKTLRGELEGINHLEIPRNTLVIAYDSVEIHGFADASIQAYGACIYMRSVGPQGPKIELLCSKVKVAPLKPLTIPRLELCGALVLAQLVAKVVTEMKINFTRVVLWSDSTVVLGWINMASGSLQVFVGNRIAQIQRLSKSENWRHVRSEDNPADLLSRGVLPLNLMSAHKWWHGPDWLQLDETKWPESIVNHEELPELRLAVKPVQVLESFQPIQRISQFGRLRRVISWCLRWRIKSRTGYLTSDELNNATTVLIKIAQRESFSSEMQEMVKNKCLAKNRNLLKLSPFIDSEGILRVGGRLQLSNFSYSQKHPILLTAKHRLTVLLFEAEHKRLLHVGPQTLLSSIREKYWVLGGRNLSRKITHGCVTCFRADPKTLVQEMGILPKPRVTPAFPFSSVGIDYAGPFLIKHIPGRGAKLIKCWISLFICMSTKAIHLEVVSGLTTEAFIACFRRFVSRRGKPREVFSDNGSNFVGTYNELKEFENFMKNNSTSLTDVFENEGISWNFIPSQAPNFGGLWEAGVRSCKHHLKRIMSNGSLTYEELSTLTAQVESVLNSRPLFPLSSSPDDLDVLTPSHFLIGRRMVSLPDPDVRGIPSNRLSNFQRIQSLLQHFWSRWSNEYVNELQMRTKWNKVCPNLEVGKLVLIKEDKMAPLNWKLGRVTDVFPGPDGRVRVAKLKTNTGELKRSISKLCPLPVN